MIITEVFVESDTIRIPGLSKFEGKRVEIRIIESETSIDREKRLKPFFDLAGTIDIDEASFSNLREASIL